MSTERMTAVLGPARIRIANEAGASQTASILNHSSIPVLGLAVLLLAGGCLPAAPSRENENLPADSVTVTRTEEGYLFAQDGDSVLFYRDRPMHPDHAYARAHYVHPLFSLDGEILTEDSPEDHPHQHGLYWAWHQVYVGDERIGDGWTQEDINWDVRDVSLMQETPTPVLRARVHWTSPNLTNDRGEPLPLVEETADFRVHPRQADYREIDVSVELLALVDSVRIGGSEDEKGYGGFSARIRLPDDVRFVGPTGTVEPQNEHVEAGAWMDMSASFGGDQPSGLAILQHPSNPGYPQPWILRRQDSMQNAKWPGAEPISLYAERPVTLRYRLVVHEGRSADINLEELHTRYAATQDE